MWIGFREILWAVICDSNHPDSHSGKKRFDDAMTALFGDLHEPKHVPVEVPDYTTRGEIFSIIRDIDNGIPKHTSIKKHLGERAFATVGGKVNMTSEDWSERLDLLTDTFRQHLNKKSLEIYRGMMNAAPLLAGKDKNEIERHSAVRRIMAALRAEGWAV